MKNSRFSRRCGITRRDFLRFMPVAGGLLLLANCEHSLPSLARTITEEQTQNEKTLSPTILFGSPQTKIPTHEPTGNDTSTPHSVHEYLPTIDTTLSKIPLPDPFFEPDTPLLWVLQERHSNRSFRTAEIPLLFISNLLWASFGINRQDGKRTAPSANNAQDIDIYLATGKGLFLYHAHDHSLIPILRDDLRPLTGSQSFVATAPINFVYVSDYQRIQASEEDCVRWSWANSGCIAQNVYLACAAMDLATVVRSSINRPPLARRMNLSENQHITLSQTIGYPV